MSLNNGPIIVAKDLTISYELHRERKKLTALQDINLEVKAGEFVVLVGPSGCGKTSFINAISGLVPKETRSVTVRGEEVTGPGPDRAMVFQDYALLPWRTVESNVRMPFEFQDLGVSEAEKKKRVQECLELVDLNGFEKFSPVRIILDNKLNLKTNSYIFKTANINNTVIFYNEASKSKILLFKKKKLS